MISAIVCIDNNYGIGNKNNLLIHIPEDIKMFKELTIGHTVIMGRNTFESLPKKPLPDRNNIVITRKANKLELGKDEYEGAIISNMPTIKNWLDRNNSVNNNDIFIIGGASVYKELLPYCERIYMTRVYNSFENVDAYFPEFTLDEWDITSISDLKKHEGVGYQFVIYNRKGNTNEAN